MGKEEKVEEKVEEAKQNLSKWVVGSAPTEFTPVLVNTETKEEIDLYGAVAKILETTEKILKGLNG